MCFEEETFYKRYKGMYHLERLSKDMIKSGREEGGEKKRES